jgi:hypothetical protein
MRRPGLDKVVLFLEDGYSGQLKESLPVELVLLPRISGRPETTLGPAQAREIERALASVTLVQLPHVGERTVAVLDRVSHEIPGAAIHLGTDRDCIPKVIQGALEARTDNGAPRRQAGERRPFVSVIAHFRQEDPDEVRALWGMIEAQGYPRTEFIVTAEGPACGMAKYVAGLPESIPFHSFNDPVVSAEAWNRGIRESFAELVILIQPGDRFETGALNALVDACQRESDAAWVRVSPLESRSALRGALIRKSAFRACGLFHTDPLYQGREEQEWLLRAARKGLSGIELATVILHAAPANTRASIHLAGKIDWEFLKSRVDLRRQNTPE